jgi:hypothetical protein
MQLPLQHLIILTTKTKLASHHGGLSTAERNRNKRERKKWEREEATQTGTSLKACEG